MPFAVTPMTMEYLQDLDYESVVQPATRVYFPLQATFSESESIFSSPMSSLFQPRPAVSSYFSGSSWNRPSMMDMPDYMMEDPAMQIVKKRRHQSKLMDGEVMFAPSDEKGFLKPDFVPETSARRSYTKNRTSFIEITAFQVPSSSSSRPTTSSSVSTPSEEVPIPHTPETELPDDISPEFSSFSSASSGTFSNIGDLDDLEDLDAYKVEHHDGCPIKGYLDSENRSNNSTDYFSSRCSCSRPTMIDSKSNDWMGLTWDNSPPSKTGAQFMSNFKTEPKIFAPGYPEVDNMELGSV
ncbi:hypothetical protein TWF569_007806 [Orbilia oligospora]|uniref:Uncharacterized protein n=1 Tax=Orbilia oligospora TaxID=2813651 RepID=A0A7C8J8L7_ORBOL|nr:hypothetical protein TWF102_006552 [Orbilia oligospora]KAF3098262.1 hypothetical protein TWF103_009085 [Orbilia oligospora]KAF3116523.1 hypothetical protein TWF706_004153 [Orbilia oligospora]KAF3121691.1 hypothetical protein TWF703_001810 [Orbilia oligospora]KAF3141579.1 hypothetical protein TWF569_007806 [Orbilia oligospora]